MRRRNFIAALGGAAIASPFVARAQNASRARRVGVMMPGNEATSRLWSATFSRALSDLGWKEGRGFTIDYRWIGGDAQKYPAVAAELVALAPDAILAPTTGVVRVLQQATRTIPIVFVFVSDPLGQGVVADLAHPGGNVTGFSWIDFTVAGKALELLKGVVPSLVRVAVLFNPKTAPQGEAYLRAIATAGQALSVQTRVGHLAEEADIESTMMALARESNSGAIILSEPFTGLYGEQIARLALKYGVPSMYFSNVFPKRGGLASYGPDELAQFAPAAAYIDRILKGAKPGDLPVQQPTKFDFVINLKTAKALGLTIPPTLLARADAVIE